jgi:signal transduction histidine kinase
MTSAESDIATPSGAPAERHGQADEMDARYARAGQVVAPSRLDAIFDAFEQADGATSRRYGGTGLGLAISRQRSHALGASVTVTSEEGSGSVVTVCFESAAAGVGDYAIRS